MKSLGILILSCLSLSAQSPLTTGSGIDWTLPANANNPLPGMVEGWHFDVFSSLKSTAILSSANDFTPDVNQTMYTTNGVTAGVAGSSNAIYFLLAAHTGGLNLANNSTIAMGAGVSFTYTVWTYFPTIPAGGVIFGKFDFTTGANQDYLLEFSSSHVFWIINNVANNAEPNIQISPDPTALAYHFYAVGYNDATGKAFASIDGSVIQTVTVAGVHSGPAALSVSQWSTAGGANSTIMKMDELYLWRRALSQAEITYLYNGGVGTFYQGGH